MPDDVDEIRGGTGDEIIAGDLGVPGSLLRRPGAPGAPGTRLTALTTALALVLVGGVVTAAWRSFASQHAPAELIPASAFAVATADLTLPHGQADALQAFADHFPSSPTRHGSGSAVDRLLRAAMRGSSDPHLDYDDDIASWLGDHVAIAGWLDDGKPQMEVLLQSRNDGAARTALGRIMHDGDGAFAFSDGYAVIASNVREVQRTIDAAHRSALAGTAHYNSDIDALPGEPAVTGWMDGAGVLAAITGAMGPEGRRMLGEMGSPMGLGPFGMGSQLQGRFAAGLTAADRYVQLDVRTVGAKEAATSDSSRLTKLPSDTIAAIEVGNPASIVKQVMPALSFLAMPSRYSETTAVGGGFVGSACPKPAFLQPPAGAPPTRRQIRRMERRLRAYAMKCAAAQQSHVKALRPRPIQAPEDDDPLAQVLESTGLQLPGDATTLLGDGAVASYGGLTLTGRPKIALRSHPKDLDAATAVGHSMQAALEKSVRLDLAVDAVGDDLVLATTHDYAALVETGGDLGGQPQATLALGDVPAQVTGAGYVDLSRLIPLLGSPPADLLHLSAVGFWGTADGEVQRVQVRLVVH